MNDGKKPHYLNLLVHQQEFATNHIKYENFWEIWDCIKNTGRNIKYNSLHQNDTVEPCPDADKSQVWTYLRS